MALFKVDAWAPDAAELDCSGPVASVPQCVLTSACRIELEAEGLVFGREEPVQLYASVRRYLPGTEARGLWRFEIKADPAASGVANGDQLVLSEFPYHNAWVLLAPFKPGLRRSPDERAFELRSRIPEAWRQEERQQQLLQTLPLNALHELLDAISWDAFETGRYLTAAPSADPAVMAGRLRALGKKGFWVLGVCRDARACLERLRRSERIVAAIRSVELGVRRVGPPSCRVQVHPQLRSEAESLMFVAMRQALAGPPSHKPAETPAELAERIFDGHLYNRARQIIREPRLDAWDDGV